MARNLRRFGEKMVLASLSTMAAIVLVGLTAHFSRGHYERAVRDITSKTFAESTEKDKRKLGGYSLCLEECGDLLDIASYGLFVPLGMAAAGGTLCVADSIYSRRKRR